MIKEKYEKEVIPKMMKKFSYKNVMAVPKIEKVVVNTGIGKILGIADPSKRPEIIKNISSDLALICGQKPVLIKAKNAIAGFKIRKGAPVGIKVVLRGNIMYDFLERLVSLALPRFRDFKGLLPRSVDNSGNLTIGIKEHIVFPEIQIEKAKIIFGFEAVAVTSAKNKEEALEFFNLMGFPIRK